MAFFSGIEVISLVHGFLGTIFLMAFGAAFAELIELTNAGVQRIRLGITVMAVVAILLYASGSFIYIDYRAPVPTSPRSVLLSSEETAWIHEVLFELKEFTGAFVPVIMLLAAYLSRLWGDELKTDPKKRRILLSLLLVGVVWTFATYGLGAYVTKTVPLK